MQRREADIGGLPYTTEQIQRMLDKPEPLTENELQRLNQYLGAPSIFNPEDRQYHEQARGRGSLKLHPYAGFIRPESHLRQPWETEQERHRRLLDPTFREGQRREQIREGLREADPRDPAFQGRETHREPDLPPDYKQDIAFKPSLSDKAARDELKLSPQELKMYGRHIGNLKGPGGVDHPNGARSTLMNMGVELGGKYYNLPRVYDGKILSPDEAVAKAQAQGLENFPSYANKEQAESRYQQIHKYMEKDAQQFIRREAGGPLIEKNAFPIDGAGTGFVTSSYADARRGGKHAGADYRAAIGTPLKAIDDGTVIKVFSEGGGNRGYGHAMDVIYKDGTVHRMAHLGTHDRSVNPYGNFKVGDSFKAGDVIAYSGRSGVHQSAPHLHYEVFANKNMYDRADKAGNSHANVGLRIDPVKYFAGGRDAAVKESLKTQVQSQGSTGGETGSRRETAQAVTERLRAAGYPDNAIAGILRNSVHESSLNPAAISKNDQPRFRGTEAAHGHGLFSEGGHEWNNMQAWMRQNRPNGHWSDPKVQADWIAHRLKTGYPKLDATLRNPNTTGEQAAQAFLNQYLRPAERHRTWREAEYGRGVPKLESYIGAAAPTAPKTAQVEVKPTAPAAPTVVTPEPPKEGPLDPSIIARQREMAQRPAPGPEDPSIIARQRAGPEPFTPQAPGIEDPSIAARLREQQQAGPTMGDEEPSANPVGRFAAPGIAPPDTPPLSYDPGRFASAGIAPDTSIEDPSIVARQREMAARPMPGPEDPSIIARQEEMRRSQGSAPIAGTEPPGDFQIAVQPGGGVGSDYAASAGASGSAATSAIDGWKPGQPIMGALFGDIFGGGGKMPAFKNLVQSYTPTPDTILPAAGPEQSVLPTSIPPPPPAPPPNPEVGPQQLLAHYMQKRRRA